MWSWHWNQWIQLYYRPGPLLRLVPQTFLELPQGYSLTFSVSLSLPFNAGQRPSHQDTLLTGFCSQKSLPRADWTELAGILEFLKVFKTQRLLSLPHPHPPKKVARFLTSRNEFFGYPNTAWSHQSFSEKLLTRAVVPNYPKWESGRHSWNPVSSHFETPPVAFRSSCDGSRACGLDSFLSEKGLLPAVPGNLRQ